MDHDFLKLRAVQIHFRCNESMTATDIRAPSLFGDSVANRSLLSLDTIPLRTNCLLVQSSKSPQGTSRRTIQLLLEAPEPSDNE